MTDYRLDDRAVGVRVHAEVFSLLQVVQTGTGAHLVSYPKDTWDPFPGEREADQWRPNSTEVDLNIHMPYIFMA
jgi:hypothetical protein